MVAVYVVVGLILGASAFMALLRLTRGPSLPDRAIALEVMLTVAIGGIAVHAAFTQQNAALPILLVISLLGFVGAVSIARFATSREEQ